MNEWMNEWMIMDEWMDEWMNDNGWMNGRMNEWTDDLIDITNNETNKNYKYIDHLWHLITFLFFFKMFYIHKFIRINYNKTI